MVLLVEEKYDVLCLDDGGLMLTWMLIFTHIHIHIHIHIRTHTPTPTNPHSANCSASPARCSLAPA